MAKLQKFSISTKNSCEEYFSGNKRRQVLSANKGAINLLKKKFRNCLQYQIQNINFVPVQKQRQAFCEPACFLSISKHQYKQ